MAITKNNKIEASDITTSLNEKAPTSHASSATTYGIGTNSNYGHTKLSDATNSTSSTSAGIAATPKAVKTAFDLANTAKTTADSAATAAADASKHIKVDLDNYTAEIRRAGNAGNYSLSAVIINKTDNTNQFKTIVSKDGIFLPTVVQKVNGSTPNSSGEITIPTGTSALGFTPVQQGGGTNMAGNKIYIGWTGSNLLAQVDSSPMGAILCSSRFPGQTMLHSETIAGTGTVTRSISVKKDCPLCLCVVMDTGDSSSFSIKVTATAGFPVNNTLMVCPKNSGIMGVVWPNSTTISLTLSGASSSNQCTIYLYAWQWGH